MASAYGDIVVPLPDGVWDQLQSISTAELWSAYAVHHTKNSSSGSIIATYKMKVAANPYRHGSFDLLFELFPQARILQPWIASVSYHPSHTSIGEVTIVFSSRSQDLEHLSTILERAVRAEYEIRFAKQLEGELGKNDG